MFSAKEMGEDELTINPDGKGFVNVNGNNTKLSQYYPHMIPMQFTGAKDMNGTDIYEGDIIRKEECSPDDPAFGHYGSIGIVKYDVDVMGFIIDGVVRSRIPIARATRPTDSKLLGTYMRIPIWWSNYEH